MSNKNINILNDILNKDGALMDTLSIKRDFKLQTNILTLIGLFSAIPRSWKKIIQQYANTKYLKCQIPIIKMETYQRKNTNIQSKDIYWCLIKAKQITPSCIERWSREDVILTDNQWKEIFTKLNTLLIL